MALASGLPLIGALVIREAIAAHNDLVARYTEEKAAWRGAMGRKFDTTREAENQQMVDAVWCYLGIRTPEELTKWITSVRLHVGHVKDSGLYSGVDE